MPEFEVHFFVETLLALVRLCNTESFPLQGSTESTTVESFFFFDLWSFLGNPTLWWKIISDKWPQRKLRIITWAKILQTKLFKFSGTRSRRKLFLPWKLSSVIQLYLTACKTLVNTSRLQRTLGFFLQKKQQRWARAVLWSNRFHCMCHGNDRSSPQTRERSGNLVQRLAEVKATTMGQTWKANTAEFRREFQTLTTLFLSLATHIQRVFNPS